MFRRSHAFFGHPMRFAYAGAGCCAPGPERDLGRHEMSPAHEGGPWSGSTFGVRRPLRFLADRLELDEAQVRKLAEILDELKTERAQAAVDDRRTLTAFAEAVAADGFDAGKAATGATLRTESGDRVAKAVVRALERMHALLRPDQRASLAYLIRTGVIGF
jgi:Spy/CpxP family protein refolding chaperone